MEVLYQVVFSGELQEGFDLKTTKGRFAKLLKLKDTQVDRFFTGRDYILKSGIDEATAMRYAMAIARTGCACNIELAPDPNDISLKPGFVERRGGDRRTKRESRRVVTQRGGGKNTSRRQVRGRRKTDFAFVLTLAD
jgi:hypothetical protein